MAVGIKDFRGSAGKAARQRGACPKIAVAPHAEPFAIGVERDRLFQLLRAVAEVDEDIGGSAVHFDQPAQGMKIAMGVGRYDQSHGNRPILSKTARTRRNTGLFRRKTGLRKNARKRKISVVACALPRAGCHTFLNICY